jgi:hypothetical protein
MRSFADRFLYSTLVNKFNAYQELWTKGMKAKEEGVRVHPLAVRAAHQGAVAQSGGSSGPPEAVARVTAALQAEEAALSDAAPSSAATIDARAAGEGASIGAPSGGSVPAGAPGPATPPPAARPRPADGLVASMRLSATSRDQDALQGLYKNFVEAKSLAGDAKLPSFDTFVREITRHAAVIKGKVDCEAIEFKIYYSGNKVSLKARPAK